MIALQFVLGHGLSSQAIAWFSAGRFSHVDAILPDGSLLGSRSDTIKGIKPGVRVRPPDYEPWLARVQLALPSTPTETQRWIDFLHSQIGKPYDKSAIWGFAAGRDWREPDSWFCSEIQARALEVSCRSPPLYSPANKITPSALALVMSALGAV